MTARPNTPAAHRGAPRAPDGTLVLTIAGACDLARCELIQLSNEVARGEIHPRLSVLLARYARVMGEAARELRDPVCLPPRRR
jgi:hypothetical protein